MSSIVSKGDTYKTVQGEGVLQETREDGFHVVTLSNWELAYGCKVQVFTKKIWKGTMVGKQEFIGREDCWDYMRALRDSLQRDDVLTGKPLSVVSALLDAHPNAAKKKGASGVKSIKYAEHKEYTGTMCFMVIRNDGSEEDFSFRKSIEILFPRTTGAPIKIPGESKRMARSARDSKPQHEDIPGCLVKVDGLEPDIRFTTVKDALNAEDKVKFVEMFGTYAEVRFDTAESAAKAAETVKDINGSMVSVTVLTGEEEKKNLERNAEARRNSRSGGKRDRGRQGGRRGGKFQRKR